ncbi:MAG: endo-1,4-beta-xylanase [Cyclobacteriaceae bacterium]|nr:endo-1,4-beta-xylanase [Cyclobacteriaceae bacterium]
MKRRPFLQKAIALAGAGLSVNYSCGKKNPNEGHEWKDITKVSDHGFGQLRPPADVLAQARENIERYRKGPLQLILISPNGDILKNSKCALRQKSHLFDWGSSSAGRWSLQQNDEGYDRWSKKFSALFNSTTCKCYWDEKWHQPIETEEGLRILDVFMDEKDWAKNNGLRAKGHPLVWTVPKAIPKWMLKYSIEEQMKRLEHHVRDLIRHGSDHIFKWDLCNEMLWEPSLRNVPEREWPHIESVDEILTYLEPAVQWAREELPEGHFALNEYGLLHTSQDVISPSRQRERYLELIEEMYKRDCAPDAIGWQAHIGAWFPHDAFYQTIDTLASSGLPVEITEFWAHDKHNPNFGILNEEELIKTKADYMCDMYTIAFGHPAVNHFTYWGESGFTDKDGKTGPFYEALYNLIKVQWSSEEDSYSNDEGIVHINAFYGHYDIETPMGRGQMTHQPGEQSIRLELR